MKFRKRPVVIEAWQNAPKDGRTDRTDIPDWVADESSILKGGALLVSTQWGIAFASPLDWVIKGVKGEISLCSPDIFIATYEPVADVPEGQNAGATFLNQVRKIIEDDPDFYRASIVAVSHGDQEIT